MIRGRNDTIVKAATSLAVALVVLWTLAPFYWMLISSISERRDLLSFPPQWLPSNPTLERYKLMVGAAGGANVDSEILKPALLFRRALINSAIAAGMTTLLSLVVGTLAGYAYSRLRFAFRRNLLTLTVVVHMLPPIATLIPLYMTLRYVGLLNELAGLILVYSALAITYVVWVMNGYFKTIPRELEESARIDGCTRFGALWRVVLPLTGPGLVATGLLVFITTWNEFLYALVLMNFPDGKTVPVVVAEFTTQFGVDYGMMMTGGVLTSLPPVVLALIFQRHLVRGLTAGAVKG